MQKLHMFLSFPGSSFFPGCVLLSAKQTDHPFRGPSCPKTSWERTNTQENSQLWSIVFGVILSSLGLVNANCGFPLWAALCRTPHQGFKPFPLTPKGPSRNGNLEMKHKNDCGEAWQTYCLWYHPFNCTGQNVGALPLNTSTMTNQYQDW